MSCIPIQDFSLISLCDATKAGKLYSIVPDSGAGDFDVTRASTATYLGSDGLLKTAANNEPRIEFNADGSYKGLLVEPAATNLFLRSEEFDNASWEKTAINTSGTPAWVNVAIAPDGTQTAEKIIPNTANTGHFLLQNIVTVSGTFYTQSIFAKAGENTILQIAGSTGFPLFFANFDLINGTVSNTNGGVATIQPMGNGWYRCSYTLEATGTGGGNRMLFVMVPSPTSTRVDPFAGNDSDGLFIWGAQSETGSVATSYIPTVASTVTRAADAISKTGISSLIGQTEGTMFVEFKFDYSDSTTQVLFKANQSNDANSVGIEVQGTTIRGLVNSSGGNIATITGTIATGTIKAALAYKTNDMAFYVNGTQVGVDTSGSIAFAGVVDILTIGQFLLNGTPFLPASRPFNQALLFKTRLTNTQLASLTTL